MDVKRENIITGFSIKKRNITYTSDTHWHSRHEFCYVIEGECSFYVNGQTYHASAGDLLFFKSGDIHRYISNDEHFICYISTFIPTIVYENDYKLCMPKTFISKSELVESGLHGRVLETFDTMYEEYEKCDKYWEAIVKSCLANMFYLLSRSFENESVTLIKDVNKFEKFQQVIDYLNKNYTEDISLEDISSLLNYSLSNTSSLFEKFIGMNFKKYLDSIRVQKSVEMIRNSDETITEIAMKNGFNNVRTFNNVFKSITGMTPMELRNGRE